ncbi:hypothetical protein ED28_09205 [[Pantoea] beijingensis]|uniref:Uncharacterized protein n=2 Tax=[Pantoea] beijingensis TaxID=1324864 RepID=A0A443IDF8_9GAMM|nr:hypothetical protein ED28_09205 [[Pantoea] beijingensis]
MQVAGHIKNSRDMVNFASTSKSNHANMSESFHLLPPGEQQKHFLSAIMRDDVDALAFMLKSEPSQSGAIDAGLNMFHNLYGKESVVWLASLESRKANEIIGLLLDNTTTAPSLLIASNACKLTPSISADTALKLFERSFNGDPANFMSQSAELLHSSAQHGNIGTLRALLTMPQLGLDINALHQGTSLLTKSIRSHNLDMQKFLINETNINPNIRDESGSTPIHEAINESFSNRMGLADGGVDTVTALLKNKKLDVNMPHEPTGREPLGAMLHHLELATRATGSGGHIPLNMELKGTLILSLLLKKPELNVNAKDTEHGQTALHTCARIGFETGVKSLVNHPDIDIHAKCFQGNRPRAYASDPEIKKLLPKYGLVEKMKKTMK